MLKREELTTEIDQLIIGRYKENILTLKQIQEEFNISLRTLNRVLKEYSIPQKASKYSKEQYDDAVKDYTGGMLQKDVCAKYGMSSVSLNKYMKKNGVNYKNQHGRKNHFNQSYFEIIDSEHKAYWFGFLYADGGFSKSNPYDKNPNRLQVSISSKDRELLVLFLKDVESENINIQDYIPKGTYSENPMSKIVLNSTKICSDMMNNGFRLLKKYSNSEVFNFVPTHLHHHFIRGFFDGDGSISKDFYIVGFSGQKGILEAINQILTKEDLENKPLTTYSDRRKYTSYQLFFKNKKSVKKIYNYMYKDATIYLTRKHTVFLQKLH